MTDLNPATNENPALAAFKRKKRPSVSRDTSLSAQDTSVRAQVEEEMRSVASSTPKKKTKPSKPAAEVVINAPSLPKQMDELITVGQRRNIRLEEKLDTDIEQLVRDQKLSIEILLEALYLIAKDNKELMEEVLTLANQRMQERKEAGKLRRIYSQMQKYN